MAKPFLAKSSRTNKLSDGEEKTYESYSLRISVYDKDAQAVRQKYLLGLGSKPHISESDAKELVKNFGKEYGFELEDLTQVRRLKIVPDHELEVSRGTK